MRKEAEALGLEVVGEIEVAGSDLLSSDSAPSPEMVEQAYQDWECYDCHKIDGEGAVKRRGPELANIGSVLSPAAMRAEILNPTSSLALSFEEDYDIV